MMNDRSVRDGLGSKAVAGNSCQPGTGRGGGQGEEAGGGEAKQGGRHLGVMGTVSVAGLETGGSGICHFPPKSTVQGSHQACPRRHHGAITAGCAGWLSLGRIRIRAGSSRQAAAVRFEVIAGNV